MMGCRWLRVCVSASVLVSCAVVMGLSASPAAAQAFETKITSVAIFKDGYSFFIREGNAELEGGWCMTQVVPPASKGTVWVFSNEANVDTVINTGDNEVAFKDTSDLSATLKRKIGLQLSVTAGGESHEGKLSHVLDDMILLSQNQQMLAVKLGEIEKVVVLGQPLRIRLEGVAPEAKVKVGLGYLAPGLSWVPSYTLELTDEHKGLLTLRGIVSNGSEVLDNCSLSLVVGVPNFIYRGQLDELVQRRLIEGAGGYGGGAMSQMAAPAAEMARAGRPAPPTAPGAPQPGFAGQEMTEMFLYKKEAVSLKAGDVGMFQIFRHEVTHESLFEWDADAGEQVWHIIQIKNDLGMPLTTGPVLVLKERNALGQDLLKYVPPGAKGNLRLTVASDIQTKVADVEVERGEPQKLDDYRYIAVTRRATLTVSNYRKEDVKVKITKSVAGRVLNVTEDGQVINTSQPKGEVDPVSTLEWDVTLKPAEQKSVECTYLSHIRL